MKLRNKKTGEIIELDYITVNEYIITLHTNNPKTEEYCYSKLLSIYEDWEDYTPVEPLIKDEKVKKLLGEVVELELTVNELNKRFVEFNKHYTELCGE